MIGGDAGKRRILLDVRTKKVSPLNDTPEMGCQLWVREEVGNKLALTGSLEQPFQTLCCGTLGCHEVFSGVPWKKF